MKCACTSGGANVASFSCASWLALARWMPGIHWACPEMVRLATVSGAVIPLSA